VGRNTELIGEDEEKDERVIYFEELKLLQFNKVAWTDSKTCYININLVSFVTLLG